MFPSSSKVFSCLPHTPFPTLHKDPLYVPLSARVPLLQSPADAAYPRPSRGLCKSSPNPHVLKAFGLFLVVSLIFFIALQNREDEFLSEIIPGLDEGLMGV